MNADLAACQLVWTKWPVFTSSLRMKRAIDLFFATPPKKTHFFYFYGCPYEQKTIDCSRVISKWLGIEIRRRNYENSHIRRF